MVNPTIPIVDRTIPRPIPGRPLEKDEPLFFGTASLRVKHAITQNTSVGRGSVGLRKSKNAHKLRPERGLIGLRLRADAGERWGSALRKVCARRGTDCARGLRDNEQTWREEGGYRSPRSEAGRVDHRAALAEMTRAGTRDGTSLSRQRLPCPRSLSG